MGFLDSLVGNLVGNATGINSRQASRWVRRIGTGNIMKIGGAAVAGAVMTHMMHEQQKKEPAPGSELPPLPSSAMPVELPPLPPVPAPGPSRPEAHDLPDELVFAVGRTLVAAALADGEMDPEERALVEKHLEQSQLPPDQKQRLHRDLVLPPTTDELAAQVADNPEAGAVLYRFGALVALADEEISEVERAWLTSLGESLGLAAEDRQELESRLLDEIASQSPESQ